MATFPFPSSYSVDLDIVTAKKNAAVQKQIEQAKKRIQADSEDFLKNFHTTFQWFMEKPVAMENVRRLRNYTMTREHFVLNMVEAFVNSCNPFIQDDEILDYKTVVQIFQSFKVD